MLTLPQGANANLDDNPISTIIINDSMQNIKYSPLHVRLFLRPEKLTGVPISQTQPQTTSKSAWTASNKEIRSQLFQHVASTVDLVNKQNSECFHIIGGGGNLLSKHCDLTMLISTGIMIE